MIKDQFNGKHGLILINVSIRGISGVGVFVFAIDTTYVDGLLGLDFFRNKKLIINFVDGNLELI